MFSSFKWKKYSKRNPLKLHRGYVFPNACEKKYLMDYNWMYTDFIETHDGPILSRLEKLQLRAIVLYYRTAVTGHLWLDSWSSQSYEVHSAKFTNHNNHSNNHLPWKKLLWFLVIGNRTSCHLILYEIIIVIDKWTPASRLSYFVNHSNDYRPNWIPLDLITIIHKTNLGNPGSVRAGRASIYEGLATLRRTIRANSALP